MRALCLLSFVFLSEQRQWYLRRHAVHSVTRFTVSLDPTKNYFELVQETLDCLMRVSYKKYL